MVIEKGAVVAGRYRLLEQVGSGAMGVVWKAQDERLGRIVAIKQLLVRYAISEELTEETRKRAMREARIAARLQHRNAIAMFDVAEHDGDPCLVMEFLPSKSLSAVLAERGTLSPAEAAEIGAQVAAALAAAHAVGIAHRDVKPGNILLADNGVVKITDFGISRALDDGTVTTQTGMLAGTPAYLAPEIARGDDPTRASDVFSLGSTLYHAIEGKPPFGNNSNPLALLHAVASGNVPPPRNAGAFAPTLMSLMRIDPTDRPTMEQAVTALAGAPTSPVLIKPSMPQPSLVPPPATAKIPVPATPTAAVPPRKPASAGPSRRNLVIVGAAAVLVLAATLTTILLLTNSREPGSAQRSGTPDQTTREQGQEEQPNTKTSPSSPSVANPIPADSPIGYTEAGQLVIKYYGDIQNAAARWQMLSPNAQKLFGSEQAFHQYWQQFTDVSSRNANGVTPNADGSVNVPVDVTYTSASGPKEEKRHLRVSRYNGQLVIDSDAK